VKMWQLRRKYAQAVDASEGQISEDAAAMREIRTSCGRKQRLNEWRCGSYEGNTHRLWTGAKARSVKMWQLRGKYALSMDGSEGWMSGDAAAAAAAREIRTHCGRE
jgi:broad specificity phosphatase PhoE